MPGDCSSSSCVLPVPSCPALPATSSLQALLQTADNPGALCSCQGPPQGPISQAALSSQQSWHVLCACAASRALPGPDDGPSIAAAVIQQTRCQHGTTLKPLLHSLPGHCSHQAGSPLDNLRSLSRAPAGRGPARTTCAWASFRARCAGPTCQGPAKPCWSGAASSSCSTRSSTAAAWPPAAPWVGAHWGTAAS